MTQEALPLTMASLRRVAGVFGGGVHGDDVRGVTDVSFPDLCRAAAFVELWRELTDGNPVELRDPVTSFIGNVVVQVPLRGRVVRQ